MVILPLLRVVSNNEGVKGQLENTLIVGCQHLLSSTVDLVKVFIRHGARPQDIFLLGKCYSTNTSVVRKLRKLGVYVSPLSNAFVYRQDFDKQYQRYVTTFVHKVLQVSGKKYAHVVLIDDGGVLLQKGKEFFKKTKCLVGVEQTSSGYRKLNQLADVQYPIVNVARSWAKLDYETPYIAEVVVQKLRTFLHTQQIRKPKILVIGKGPVGQCIAEKLKHTFKVKSYSIRKDTKEITRMLFGNSIAFDVIIGATGQTIFPIQRITNDSHVTLVSASSSDREFAAFWVRRKFQTQMSCHKNITFGRVTLLNCGFPVNFDGKQDSVTRKKIQITRALLASAVFQALREKRKGIVPLERNRQKILVKHFISILKKE